MPSTFTSNLGIEKPADGEQDAVWGQIVNENMDILDRAINGQVTLTLSGTSSTLTTSTSGTLTNGQYKLLVLAGTPSGTHTITIAPNDAQKIYFVQNNTAQSVVFTQGSGGNVTIAPSDSAIIYSDGALTTARVQNITDSFAFNSVKITGGSIDGTTVGATTASTGAFTTGTFNLGSVTTPSITFAGDTNTGIWSPGADLLAISTGGVEKARFSGGDVLFPAVSTESKVVEVGVNRSGDGISAVDLVGDTTYSDYGARFLRNGGANGATQVNHRGTGVLQLATEQAAPVLFVTNSVERVRIDAVGNVGVGAAANAAALLDLTSTTKGFRAPSMTTGQRDAIASPVGGLLIYNTSQLSYQAYNGTSWTSVGGGATGGGADQVFVENGQTVTANYTIPATKNAMSTGPVSINSGVTVTVSSGARYVVL